MGDKIVAAYYAIKDRGAIKGIGGKNLPSGKK
jgi:hypothetical protein